MSTNLAIELNERTYDALSNAAQATGKTPAELAATVVESIYGGRESAISDAAAREQFERFFGSVDVGRPIGIANDAIDADLACEYGLGSGTT